MNDAPALAHDDFLSAKIRMIMKLRGSGVNDTNVLKALELVPRELFVPRMFQDKTYEDIALPIESGQTISQPSIVANMTQALSLGDKTQRVLEIGTGSGYQASVLAHVARRVYTIERHKDLLDLAIERFEQLKLSNITPMLGDGIKGWKDAAPFDRIMVTAAAEEVPEALLEQMEVGGIMVIPVGDVTGEQELLRIERTEAGYSSQQLMKVRFVPLIAGKAAA